MTIFGNRDTRVGLAIMLIALTIVFFLIPSGVSVPENVEVRVLSPDFWPIIVSLMAGIAGAFVFIGGVLEQKRAHLSETTSMPDESVPVEGEEGEYRDFGEATFRVVVTVCVLLALYFTADWAGFVLGNMILLVFMIRFTGEKRWKMILSIALILPSILYGFFVYVASVPIPLGIFEQFRG